MQKQSQSKRANKRKVKRLLFLTLCLFVFLLLLMGALYLVLLLVKGGSDESTTSESRAFFEADYNKNIYEDEVYMQLNHAVKYLEFGSGIELDESNYKTAGVASTFFYGYFNAIIDGDAKKYRSYLTDTYIEEVEPPERFTMQTLYNIEVNEVQQSGTASYHGYEVTTYYFSVTYSIFENDGTFDREIGSNTPITRFYELYRVNGQILLNAAALKQVRPSA